MSDNQPGSANEFYVGYLPVPRGHRRFLRLAVPITLWGLAIVSVIVAASQPDPGPAVWKTGTARSFTGVLIREPYPMLLASDRGDGRPGILLLVEVGKRGAGGRVAGYAGASVVLSGWLLEREGRTMLELEPGDGAIRSSTVPAPAVPAPRPLGRVTLRGEIVDSKCYLGAMKPGHGRTHKECATLCITGGIPPMLVTRDADGAATCYLLLDPSGAPLENAAYPFIADPVEVTGECEEHAGLLRLRIRAADVRRL